MRLVTICHIFGGDEESRTPVHNTFQIDFYKFSSSFIFILFSPINRLKQNIAFKIPTTSKAKVALFPTYYDTLLKSVGDLSKA